MKHGFIKVACASPDVAVANPAENAAQIAKYMDKAHAGGANLCVFPELCLTGYTCGDLFYSEVLLREAEAQLLKLRDHSKGLYPVFVVGVPLRVDFKLYNCAAVLHDGQIIGIVPKTHLPNYGEFYEKRQFTPALEFFPYCMNISIVLGGESVPMGTGMVFSHAKLEGYRFGIEICEDLWAPDPPSRTLCAMGATILLNPSASNEIIGKREYRRMLVNSTSARLACGYVYVNAGPSESTQDVVFSRHDIISENGTLLNENAPFDEADLMFAEIDVNRLTAERQRMTCYALEEAGIPVTFDQEIRETPLTRPFAATPFVPASDDQIHERAEDILRIQTFGLRRRIEHVHAQTAVVGISGGLDSCLALLVSVRAMDLLKRDRKDVLAISMPCFGTTERTRSNAQRLCEQLGVTFREIDISQAVRRHFADIGHDETVRDVTYENSQARERTQVLMDMANQTNGLVVGTGDLSELALGWATYNGDHMSMYGVNASIPKTLMRYIVRHVADISESGLKDILLDILDTPVSPELLPAEADGTIHQKTEDIVGPYELHDFFLYYTLRFGFAPDKILRLAKIAFNGMYDEAVIRKWLATFIRRFFSQQYKRSCLPDGPKVGSVALSPRGDWRMPSDASAAAWLDSL